SVVSRELAPLLGGSRQLVEVGSRTTQRSRDRIRPRARIQDRDQHHADGGPPPEERFAALEGDGADGGRAEQNEPGQDRDAVPALEERAEDRAGLRALQRPEQRRRGRRSDREASADDPRQGKGVEEVDQVEAKGFWHRRSP